tara:strand:+ start:285 stop:614 length:330 start_codon:yes stop_codon:yes gene_type:complete
MKKLLNEWRKYLNEVSERSKPCGKDEHCLPGEKCVDKRCEDAEPSEEEEEPLEESDWKKKQEAACRKCEADAARGNRCTKTRWYAANCEQHDKPAMPWEKKKQPWEEGP